MSHKRKFPIMQTHLDFHTSPDIEGIGKKFSKENFQNALKVGNLDSITVFAKCHHSMCYYPTKVGTMHPHLDFDLCGAMIDAAHEVGVRAPVYITVGFSEEDSKNHPEWIAVDKERKQVIRGNPECFADINSPRPYSVWNVLCFCDGGEYAEHIYALTEEVCKRYESLDGLFYDICNIGKACYCASCIRGMKKMGLNPDDDIDARKYFVSKRQAFFKKCTDILKTYHPDATIFFNGCAEQHSPEYHDYQTHFELEDLPTAWGGYDKLPMRAKFFAHKGKGLIGMTGKFHLSWGEFGGFKSRDALKFEVATMALFGVGCSVGDHLHPDGEMELQTYENIGYAYKYLEKIEPFCFGGEEILNIGVFPSQWQRVNDGISNILLENQIDYDIVTDNNFDRFDTVIIPEYAQLNDYEVEKLKDYINNGGKLLVAADGLVKDNKFQLDIGIKYLGKSEYDCDYLVPTKKLSSVPDAPMLCDLPGERVEVDDNAQIFAEFITPYFTRTYAHFCGHRNTPHDKNSKRYPAIVKCENVVYVAHPLAKEYNAYGSPYHKHYFMEALKLVYGGGALAVKGLGVQGRSTMIHQPDENRYCLNMVYASPVRRGMAEIIEDIMPVYNISVEFKTDKAVKRVYMPLDDKELEFNKKDGRIEFIVPELNCHTTVTIEY